MADKNFSFRKAGLSALIAAGMIPWSAGWYNFGYNFSKNSKKQNQEISVDIFEDYLIRIPLDLQNPNKTLKPEGVKETGKEIYPNPEYTQNDNFSSDTEIMILARTLYGEARGQIDNEDYVYGIARTITNRADKTGKTLKDIILKSREKNGKTIYHYTCFDPKDPNYSKIKDPLNAGDGENTSEREKNWRRVYDIAKKVINGDLGSDLMLEEATNYFVSRGNPIKHKTRKEAQKMGIPGWAFHMENGKFVLDEHRRRIPINPLAVVDINSEKKAYFYSFKNF